MPSVRTESSWLAFSPSCDRMVGATWYVRTGSLIVARPSAGWLSGRPVHCPFRGLLGVHSRYGLHTRAVTNS